jgi:uncharacterized protein (DUF1501 family)
MLKISGSPSRCCNGLTRRDLLKVGALAGGLTLSDLLRLRANGNTPSEAGPKSVIMIWLYGGPSHIDMYDLKPDAPAEYRGEFKPIRTKTPGLDICELMPRQALIANKFSLLRNMKYKGDVEHIPPELLTGWTRSKPQRPAFGSVISRFNGGRNNLPGYASLMGRGGESFEDPSYAGLAHRPFVPSGPGLDNLRLTQDVSLDQLADRRSLLRSFDTLRHDLDEGIAGYDAFTARAMEMITTTRARDAFDLEMEPDRVRSAYGPAQQFLLARRLVEAGVSVVTVHSLNGRNWDSHERNFKFLRDVLPLYDQGVAALVNDIYDRGLDKDVLVVVWGEMGRTPRVNNKEGGRDHWWSAGFTLLAGGGLPAGQVIGATDGRAEQIVGNAYTPQNMLATIYTVLGIDPAATLTDHSGRPISLLDDTRVIQELV